MNIFERLHNHHRLSDDIHLIDRYENTMDIEQKPFSRAY
jgi:hypothetical protein